MGNVNDHINQISNILNDYNDSKDEKAIKTLQTEIYRYLMKNIKKEDKSAVFQGLDKSRQKHNHQDCIREAFCQFYAKEINKIIDGDNDESRKKLSEYIEKDIPEKLQTEVINKLIQKEQAEKKTDLIKDIYCQMYQKKILDACSEFSQSNLIKKILGYLNQHIPETLLAKLFEKTIKETPKQHQKTITEAFCKFHVKKIEELMQNQTKADLGRLSLYTKFKTYINESIPTALRKHVYQRLSFIKDQQIFSIIKQAFITSYKAALEDKLPKRRASMEETREKIKNGEMTDFVKYIKIIPENLKEAVKNDLKSSDKVEGLQKDWVDELFKNSANADKNQENVLIGSSIPQRKEVEEVKEEKEEKNSDVIPINQMNNGQLEHNEMKSNEEISIENFASFKELQAHSTKTYNGNKNKLLETFLADLQATDDYKFLRQKLNHDYKLDENNALIKIDDDQQKDEITLKSHTRYISKLLIYFGCCCSGRSTTEKLIDSLAQEMDEKLGLNNN